MKHQALIILLLLSWTTPAAAAFAIKKIYIDEMSGEKSRLSETDLKSYFNSARCACANTLRVTVEITRDQAAKGKIKVLSGSGNCLTTENDIDQTKCRVHFSGRIRDQDQDIRFDVPASSLMLKPGASCSDSEESDYTIYVVTDKDDDEYTASAITMVYAVDTTPPSAPKAKSDSPPQAGEGLVKVSFETGNTTEKNIKYQVLCQQVDFPDQAPRLARAEDAEYEVAANATSCGARKTTTADGGPPAADGAPGDAATSDALKGDARASEAGSIDATATDGGAGDAGVTSGGITALDPMFVCSKAVQTAGSIVVSQLKDDTSYRFYVVSIDFSGNASPLVDLGQGTPAPEEDLWERYKRSGGSAAGGCGLSSAESALGGGALLSLLILLVVLIWRRRRRSAGLALGLLMLLCPGIGKAQATESERYASPQSYAMEIKVGPYAPNIDSEFNGGAKPFADIFGDGEALMIRGEFDYQIWSGFGSVGVGLSAGYYGNSASSLVDNGADGRPSSSTKPSAGKSTLMLIPISVLAIYRFDVLANHYRIPLVPFVKFGLNYTIWTIRQGSDSLASYQGNDASGGSWGIQFNAGIALQLDIFEPPSAKSLDNEVGINHSYVFFEFVRMAADGFGSASKLNVGDTTWQGGLAFEF